MGVLKAAPEHPRASDINSDETSLEKCEHGGFRNNGRDAFSTSPEGKPWGTLTVAFGDSDMTEEVSNHFDFIEKTPKNSCLVGNARISRLPKEKS
jgi:hypothetical protein